ncbi:hypothetical protein [Iningainema tapete]|uniref:Uncharacterized protein n=1 Tax=Iningainema tapete BLCC-T55 TaxID=2748662 RepID=A0A8J6XF57_9CYAN|nr:hypothetical protein [Iningainema tapete]MBD2771715.1 hypothetical protein [Iningainema tapete BLCC-T55]
MDTQSSQPPLKTKDHTPPPAFITREEVGRLPYVPSQPLPDLKSFQWTGAKQPKNSVNPRLEQKLMTLLNGDTTIAQRLLQQQRQLHPGNTDNWYLEKVVDDLKRDRHCR